MNHFRTTLLIVCAVSILSAGVVSFTGFARIAGTMQGSSNAQVSLSTEQMEAVFGGDCDYECKVSETKACDPGYEQACVRKFSTTYYCEGGKATSCLQDRKTCQPKTGAGNCDAVFPNPRCTGQQTITPCVLQGEVCVFGDPIILACVGPKAWC